MLIVCDFDGTATKLEPLTYLAAKFAPRTAAGWKRQLDGESSLREVFSNGFNELDVDVDTLVNTIVRDIPLRDGLRELLDEVRGRGDRFAIVSAGFRQFIEPMLAAGGAGDVELIASDLRMTEDGIELLFREQPVCDACGEHCKRADIAALRRGDEPVLVIGDGYSDRCGAQVADVVFACGDLREYLDASGVAYRDFGDFTDVTAFLRATR